MIKSMTGFGTAHARANGIDVTVELKAVNGRFFKIVSRIPPALTPHEVALEKLVKARVHRGSVSLSIFLQETNPEALVSLNEPLIEAYQAAFRRLGLAEDQIPLIPGVLDSPARPTLSEAQWETVQEVIRRALARLVEMRAKEGAALRDGLRHLCDEIEADSAGVAERSPAVVQEVAARLRERIGSLLDEGVALDTDHMAREVAFFAGRADITEETDRLAVHISQMRERLGEGGEVGRTLEFIAQEMLREVNTIGSKSADAQIARLVVGLKSSVEKIKEQVANIE